MSREQLDTRVVCPVKGCSYSAPVRSVAGHVSGKKDPQHDWRALGYDGYYQYIREQKEAQHTSKTVLVHMTDSHIGREKGGHFGSKWSINCAAGFQNAVEAAISVGADAVIHTGDLFHNDHTTGITGRHIQVCHVELARLKEADIPFYFLLGDHERQEGEKIRNNLEEYELTHSLSTTPTLVGDHIALYGVDYQPDSWWENRNFAPKKPPSDRISLLALHQSLQQFVKPDQAECDAKEILRRTQSTRGFRFDAILVGQHHRDDKEVVQGCEVLCGGATERISKRSFEPFVREFTVDFSGFSHRKIILDV